MRNIIDEKCNAAGCTLCPRECNADRASGETGFCSALFEMLVARAALHMWEEPCISGERGAGTVFFSGCPLKCSYCQNVEISRGRAGKPIDEERLAEIFFELRDKGAHNIDLVTPTHYSDRIAVAIELAKSRGFDRPIIWNCGGYEKVESLKRLDGLVDIYMPDFKYMDPKLAQRLSGAFDYPIVAREALKEMFRQRGKNVFCGDMMTSGLLVRHLILPGHTSDSMRVLDTLHDTFGDDIYISIMSQYTPMGSFPDDPELERTLTKREYDRVVDHAIDIGIENGFTQEGGAAKESFIPAFDLEGVLKD